MSSTTSLGVAVVTALLFSPILVSAATIAELQAQIQALMAQIAALQSQQTTPAAPVSTGATSAACPNLTRNFSRGSRGADVMQLQQFLISQNFLAVDSATGFYGALTESAVKQFQCQKMSICSGSPASNGYGAVGPRTRAAIVSVCSTTAVPITPNSLPTRSQTAMPTPTQPETIPPTRTIAPVDIVTTHASCNFNGQAVAHGASITAYQASSVPIGQQCGSQQRTCGNGTLSGSYAYASCVPQKSVAVGTYFATWYVSHANDYYIVNNDKNNPLSKKITPYENIKQGRTLLYQIDGDAMNGGISSCNTQGHSTDWCDQYPEIKDIVGFPIRNVVSNGQTVPLAINLEEMKYIWGDLSLTLGGAGFVPDAHNPNWKQFQDGVLTLKRYWATAPASDEYVHDFIKNPMTIFPEPADNSRLRYADAEDPATVSLQKKLAHDYGIDFFGLEWYWNYNSSHVNKEILMKGDPIDTFFFKTPAIDNLTGALMWVVLNHEIPNIALNHPQDFTNETVDVMCERLSPYVQSNQYTVINGKALLYVLGVPTLFDNIKRDRNVFISGFNRLRNCVHTKTGKDIGFTALSFGVDQDGFIVTNDMLKQAGFVNVVADGPGWTEAKNYDEYSSKLTSYWESAKNKYASLIAIPGVYLADHPELIVEAGSAYYRQNNTLLSLDPLSKRVLMPNSHEANGGSSPEKFRDNIVRAYNRAKALAESSGKQIPIFLYSWNNQGEGTSLEPDKVFGCKYLDAIKSVIDGKGTRLLQFGCPGYVLY